MKRHGDFLILPRLRGRGTARSAVEGAAAVNVTSTPHAPSTMLRPDGLRMVPLPRVAALRRGG